MRRKSIGATSQAFHEVMSTGAFLEFLRRLGCRDAGLRGFPNPWGPAQRLKCWSEDGNPVFDGSVKLRIRKPSNAPQGQRIGGYGSNFRHINTSTAPPTPPPTPPPGVDGVGEGVEGWVEWRGGVEGGEEGWRGGGSGGVEGKRFSAARYSTGTVR